MISIAWKCLLLWRILIFGGSFEQEGTGEKKTGGGGMHWSYGMDGSKDNEVMSAGWQCLLLWQILIFGGAFEQEGSGGAGGGGRAGHFNMCAETINR